MDIAKALWWVLRNLPTIVAIIRDIWDMFDDLPDEEKNTFKRTKVEKIRKGK